eukprot:15454868-Alexandrium_andersonii.AAC.1
MTVRRQTPSAHTHDSCQSGHPWGPLGLSRASQNARCLLPGGRALPENTSERTPPGQREQDE